jgi:argininosuccinate lyase
MMTTNLPSGYHRDLQLLKEHLFPAFQTLKDCINMASLMLNNISIKENIVTDEKYKYIFSVEEVNKLVLQGVPFRDAYKQVGLAIEANQFEYSTEVNHTHEGSIGNLNSFGFQKVEQAITKLLSQ